jgi:hypothetical protein
MTEGKGLGKNSIVAIVRRLTELLYTLMKNGTEYEVRKFVGGKERDAGETLVKQALAG